MKKFFPSSGVFKTLSFLILIVVLVLTPCGIKQSVKQIFNIENLTSNSAKSGSSCQYVQFTALQKSQQVAVKKEDNQYAVLKFTDQILISTSVKTGFRKARSVPLYILYQQLRSSLV
ncbi:hypothetical protein Q73A0000_04650 [Kaistella flava (ex Peng et al. 2021)]|uniref:Uncharacterized protein n=1 Tax=Kaistella flava (ex Peng et al. 2021) TaxID=2038776 RepID=A0A7M2Y8P6_9FLAO|nr:hypothetical protein [Kaistella flava (ex Peng et al. 2021)]QOW09703.1 hypothetical protein Q73A0000_04650 [Kaistella flava (ex Peng et al. 2021)]